MSDFYNKYPYTDFHELNLDWVLERVKQLTEEWASTLEAWQTTQQDWIETEEAWISFKSYVENYLANLDVQDEINNKLDQMAADGTLDALLLPYFNAYKAEINGIIELHTQQIASLDSRVTQIASLPEGSTTGDAELIDIRTPALGFHGNVAYASAGDAVRGQVTTLNDNEKHLSDITNGFIDIFTQISEDVTTLSATTTYADKLYDYYDNDFDSVPGANVKKFTVSGNLAYFVTTGVNAGVTHFPLVTYFASDDSVLGYEYMNVANTDTSISRQFLVIPENTAYFYINARGTTSVCYRINNDFDKLYAYGYPLDFNDAAPSDRPYAIQNAAHVNAPSITPYIGLLYVHDSVTGYRYQVYIDCTKGIVFGRIRRLNNVWDAWSSDGFSELASLISDLSNQIHDIDKWITEGRTIVPAVTTKNYMYSYVNQQNTYVNGGCIKKYPVESGHKYLVTTSLYAGSAQFPLVSYFAADDSQISYEYMNATSGDTAVENVTLNIPNNAAYFLINSRDFESFVVYDVALDPDISILFVGNSMTQDAISYIPLILKKYYPDINFNFYLWYNGGKTLAEHYQYFIDDEACQVFSVAENSYKWINYSNTKTMSSILSTYKIDIVCMQEYFNYKESYTESDLDDWNDCRDYIVSHYTGGNPLEFISLLHAPLRTDLERVYALTVSGNELILQKTICQDIIPCGIAIYNALGTSIGTLGDGGDLTTGDRTHTQEGVPCLIQDYTVVSWLLDRLGKIKSVYGCPLRMNTDVYSIIDVPGPNLGNGIVTGTDADNLMAQEVAILAMKEGKSIVYNNLTS